jgi:tetratricopeptide (TPR) repeat protein
MPAGHNGFEAGRWSTAIVVALVLLACSERHNSTIQGTEMRVALTDLASAEDVYYASNLRYSADQSTIVALTLPTGVTLSIESADERGWHASASHEHGVETCSVSGRNDGNAALAIVDGPNCTPLHLSATLKDVRGRTVSPATSVRADAPAPVEPAASAPAVSAAAAGISTAQPVGNISVLLPVVGTQTEDFGYPTQTIDRLAVRRLLMSRSYGVLDRLLAAYADSVLRDYRVEYRLFDAYAAFGVAVPALEPFLNEWVQQRPTSAAARLARATFFRASGWNARGARYASKTSNQQFVRMGKFFQLTFDDLTEALRLEPKSIVAYRQLIDLATTQREAAMSRQMLDQALKIQPYSFLLRATYMHNLLPRWGGSYEAMARFAEESAPYAKRNPRINALKGFVDWDKGRISEAAGRNGDAIEAYNRALQFGNFWEFRYERGTYNSQSDLNEEALEDFNSVLAQFPQDADALNDRCHVEYELGRTAVGEAQVAYYSQAFRDIVLAAALDPTDADIRERRAFMHENIPEFEPPPEQ